MPRQKKTRPPNPTDGNGHASRLPDDLRVDDDGTVKGRISITPPNFQTITIPIVGTTYYVQDRFPEEAADKMHADQAAGSTAKKGKKRDPKNFQKRYEQAKHRGKDGALGIPATAFLKAMVSACRVVGFKMTHAKLAIRVIPDDFDPRDGTPLVHFAEGEAHYFESIGRNANGSCDIRVRARWNAGWRANLTLQYDADIFTRDDVANLVNRAGAQVGIGNGRPDSRDSVGMGWGLFDICKEDGED